LRARARALDERRRQRDSLEHFNALRFADAEPWEKGNDDSTS